MWYGDQRKVQICEPLLIKPHLMVHSEAAEPRRIESMVICIIWKTLASMEYQIQSAKLHLRREKASKLQLQTTEDKMGVSVVVKYI